MNRWAIYAVTSAVLVGLSALVTRFVAEPPARVGIWVGLAAAWFVQIVAFAILVAVAARRQKLMLAGWTAGTLLRLIALGGLAWLTLGGVWRLPAEPTLIATVIALFALLILEPVFFRYRLGTR